MRKRDYFFKTSKTVLLILILQGFNSIVCISIKIILLLLQNNENFEYLDYNQSIIVYNLM